MRRATCGALTFSGFVLAVLAVLDTRLSALQHVATYQRRTDEASIPAVSFLRFVDLQHHEWAADLLWCSALVYFGETVTQSGPQRYLQRYGETIEDLDPDFLAAYQWAALVSVYNSRRISLESIQNANRHLERAARRFPENGEVLYELGFNNFFELAPRVQGAERQNARRRGALYLRRAAALGYGPEWMGLAAVAALSEAGLEDQAVQQLQALYFRTENPTIRARIEARIRELQTSGSARSFLAEVQRMDRERSLGFPYASRGLFLFVGAPLRGIVSHDRVLSELPASSPQ